MTTIRLVWGGPRGPLRDAFGVERDHRPALLVSYWHAGADGSISKNHWPADRPVYKIRDYALDSGAFTAHNSGTKIDPDAYLAAVQERLADDPELTEAFALDVIGDWRASLANTEAAWSAGVPMIPTYHVGEPAHVLEHLAATYPKIALGGAVGMHSTRKIAWARECMHRIWPKPVHGLGFGGERAIMALPFHSVDATNWQSSPTRWGRWESMPGASYKGWGAPLRVELEWWLRLERRVQARWAKEMTILDQMMKESACT